jgi:hypothetical protein
MELRIARPEDRGRRGGRPRSNLRTALVLLSIAAAFFAGVVVKRAFFS